MHCLKIWDLYECVEVEPSYAIGENGNLTKESQVMAKTVRRARSRILIRVSSRHRGVLKHCKTTKQVCDKLEGIYKNGRQLN